MSSYKTTLVSESKVSMQNSLMIWIAFMLFIISHTGFAVDFSSSSSTGLNTGSTTTSSATTQPVTAIQPSSSAVVPPVTGLSTTLSGQSLAPVPAINPQSGTNVQSPTLKTVDYSANLKSDVFGTHLFTGSFAQQGVTQFNPDYMITIGDQLQVRLWGGYVFDGLLTVDPQGNVFLPQVGPIKVLGVHNQDLQRLVESAVRRVFRANVFSYASLAKAHPVRVFVGGFVNRPGLYYGTSMDSLLHYLDQAGGIDPERGSFLNLQIKRGKQVRATLNLYDFLLQGRIPLIQLADGDVIFTSPRQNTIKVSGLAESTKRFEFQTQTLTIAQLSRLAKPSSSATHVRVVRNVGIVKNIDYYALTQASMVEINNGDEVEFTADKKPGTITVRIEGEHQSPQEYVLPYGAHMGDLLRQIKFSERSDTASIQLYRQSMRERQKSNLAISLKNLESSVLTARSDTSEEASLRKEEADLILQWIERAKTIEPNGQVSIVEAENREDLLLENGDVVKVPVRDGLVLVSGEVLFPNTIAYDNELSLEDYINLAGGYSQNADNARVIIMHRDGRFDDSAVNTALRAGDVIMVMPKVDVKSYQIGKELMQILFQIAIAASVVLLL